MSNTTKFWTFAPTSVGVDVTDPMSPVKVQGSFHYVEIKDPPVLGGDPELTVDMPFGMDMTFSLPMSLFPGKTAADISGQMIMDALEVFFGQTPYQHAPPAPKDINKVLHRVPPSKRTELLKKLYPKGSLSTGY